MTARGFGALEADYMLWHHGFGGREPGDFFKSLIGAVVRADPQNLERIRQGFPELVAAFEFFHANPVSATRAVADGEKLQMIGPDSTVQCDRCRTQWRAQEVADRLDCGATIPGGRCRSGDFDGVDVVDLASHLAALKRRLSSG